jgi:hypothetical protein
MPITDPTDIAGCHIWLAADAIVGLADGDRVTTWADGSGNGNDATSAGLARPMYKTGILNSLPVVRFLGSAGEFMTWANVISSLTAGTFFAVIKNSAAQGSSQLGHPMKAGASGSGDHYPYADSVIYDGWGSDSRKTTGTPAADLRSWHHYTVKSASGEWTAWHDGTQHYTTSSNTVSFTTAPELARSSGNHWDGDIAELIVYDSALVTADIQDVWDYLDAKWFGAAPSPALPPPRLSFHPRHHPAFSD